jgi:NAD(P)-dependent dehydrogenase (short-subunit alcohol dehydrogenase family)
VKRLQGKVAIVTGGGRGIGRAVATAFGQNGAKVLVNDFGSSSDKLVDKSSGPADEVAQAIKDGGGEAAANYDDVASMSGGESIVQQAVDLFGTVDILVTCAGNLRERMIFNMTEEEWDDVIAVHLKGHFTVTKYATQVMRQQRSGRLIAFSSNGAFGAPHQANYAAAKGGVLSFARSNANALAQYNITSNAILPLAATRLTDRSKVLGAGAEPGAPTMSEKPPPEMDPANIAPVCVYLASDEAQGVSGCAFGAGGGFGITLYEHTRSGRTIFSDGPWDVDRLFERFPQTLGAGLVPPSYGRGEA